MRARYAPDVRRPLAPTLAFCLCVAYVGIGQRVGQQYPLSPLPMWSRPVEDGARVIARSPRGVAEVSDYAAWDCPSPVDFASHPAPRCATHGLHPEFDRYAQDWVRAHTAALPHGTLVEIVRRSYWVTRRGGPMHVAECVLARCRASHRSRHAR